MNAPTSRLTLLPFTCIVLALLTASAPLLHAQNRDASPRFPEPAQVVSDYPDPVQRAAAFTVLAEALAQAAPKPISQPDTARILKYNGASNALLAQEMIINGQGSQDYQAFNARYNQLTNDASFLQSILDRYRLNGLPTYATPPPTVEQEMKYDVPTHLPQALPWILVAGILPMALAAWLVLRGSGIGRKILPVPASVVGGLPPLPKALQVVSLPGVRYAAYVLSGRVLDIQTSSHSSSHTTTTGGEIFQSSTGQVHTTPVQSWTTVINKRETLIWVRTPDNREAPWTLMNSNFQCRVGQIISILVRPVRDGGEILLAYNHTTGVLERNEAIRKSHEPRGNELGQWAANIAGGFVAAKVLSYFLPMYGGGRTRHGLRRLLDRRHPHAHHRLLLHHHPPGQDLHLAASQRPLQHTLSSRLSPILRARHWPPLQNLPRLK